MVVNTHSEHTQNTHSQMHGTMGLSLSNLCSQGELINLAMYCERIRRRFWPEWFVDLEDFCYSDSSEDSGQPDLGLYSHTDTFQETPHTHKPAEPLSPHTHTHTPAEPLSPHTHTHTPAEPLSPDSDRTGQSLYDSDMDTECSEIEQFKC